MMGIFDRLRDQREDSPNDPAGEDTSPAQSARDDPRPLDAVELEARLDRALTEIDRLNAAFAREREATRRATGDQLAAGLSAPLAQLAVQVNRAGDDDAAVTIEDIASTARRLVSEASALGIRLEGTIGDSVRFDPDRHVLVNDTAPSTDDVVVLIPAVIGPSGRIVRKATVEAP